MGTDSPTICPCPCTCDFLSKLDPNVYDVETKGNFVTSFWQMVCDEFCDLRTSQQISKNNFYLSVEVDDEPVIKGQPYGQDCLINKAVVDIISVGNTLGASDYRLGIDFLITECGIQWRQPYTYYPSNYYPSGYYPSNYPSGYPINEMTYQPETGAIYYVNYRFGCQNSLLYNNFGVFVGLQKQDYQSYPNYRKALQCLIKSYLLGPTIAGITEALSIFTPASNLKIIEGYQGGWELDVSLLGEGTILASIGEDFTWDLYVYNSDIIEDKNLFTTIVNRLKPAHTICFISFF